MDRTGKRRLLKLADLLEADAKNKKGVKFDLGTWAAPAEVSDDARFFKEQAEVPINCGTAACAVGLACLSGIFKKSGLTYDLYENGIDSFRFRPKFNVESDFPAVEKFFRIDSDESTFLFDQGEYPYGLRTGAKAERFVAKRIRDFVVGKVSPTS